MPYISTKASVFRELWVKFKSEYPELYALYQYQKQPNTAPKVFRDNAPFEMIKAPDQSCLCVNCEDMNNLLRGSTYVCNAIEHFLTVLLPITCPKN